jgi:hypothetical protein
VPAQGARLLVKGRYWCCAIFHEHLQHSLAIEQLRSESARSVLLHELTSSSKLLQLRIQLNKIVKECAIVILIGMRTAAIHISAAPKPRNFGGHCWFNSWAPQLLSLCL